MKPDDTRTSPQAAAGQHHLLDHEIPTVIHHPEEDQPLLRVWVDRAMANPTRFWGLLAAAVVVLTGLSLLAGGLSLGKAASDEAWTKLETAKTAAERVEIAKDFPKTAAERYALLQAATEFYNQGAMDLPANRDVALPTLKKALDLFQKVADEAPADTPQARVAAFGLARTYEARNELDKAVAQYRKVAATKAWAGTEEARSADRLAKVLKTPEAVAFYKDLYSYKRTEMTLPAGGTENFKLPFDFTTPPGSTAPAAPGAAEPNPLLVPPPPPSPPAAPADAEKAKAPAGSGTRPSEAKSESLPADLFAPPPKPDAPKSR